jgi:hypothetical protein
MPQRLRHSPSPFAPKLASSLRGRVRPGTWVTLQSGNMGDTFAYSPGESAKSSNDVSLDRRRSFFSSGSPSSGEASTANLRDTRPSDGLAKPTRVASHERGLRYTPPAGRILAEGENFTRLNTVTYVPGLKCYPCPRIVPPEALSQSGEEAFGYDPGTWVTL